MIEYPRLCCFAWWWMFFLAWLFSCLRQRRSGDGPPSFLFAVSCFFGFLPLGIVFVGGGAAAELYRRAFGVFFVACQLWPPSCFFLLVWCCFLLFVVLGQHGSFIVASSRTGGPADRQSTRRWSTGLPDCAGPPDYRTARRRPNPDFDGDELTYIKCSSARHVVAVVWPLYAPYIQMLP